MDPYDLYDTYAGAANAAAFDALSLLRSTGLEPISGIFRTTNGQFTYVPFVLGSKSDVSNANLAGSGSIFINTGHFATQVTSIHGHPGSTPPSSDDLRNDLNRHMVGIVVGLNGSVYVHKPANENNNVDTTGIKINVDDVTTVEELVVMGKRKPVKPIRPELGSTDGFSIDAAVEEIWDWIRALSGREPRGPGTTHRSLPHLKKRF